MNSISHTPAQKRRMLTLARYLDKLPRKKLDMRYWQFRNGCRVMDLNPAELKHDCGTAACGCGHAVMIPSIRCITANPAAVSVLAFGIPRFNDAFNRLFGGHRTCTPKWLARNLRRYVKTDELPRS